MIAEGSEGGTDGALAAAGSLFTAATGTAGGTAVGMTGGTLVVGFLIVGEDRAASIGCVTAVPATERVGGFTAIEGTLAVGFLIVGKGGTSIVWVTAVPAIEESGGGFTADAGMLAVGFLIVGRGGASIAWVTSLEPVAEEISAKRIDPVGFLILIGAGVPSACVGRPEAEVTPDFISGGVSFETWGNASVCRREAAAILELSSGG